VNFGYWRPGNGRSWTGPIDELKGHRVKRCKYLPSRTESLSTHGCRTDGGAEQNPMNKSEGKGRCSSTHGAVGRT
jgi:hypothetical protein